MGSQRRVPAHVEPERRGEAQPAGQRCDSGQLSPPYVCPSFLNFFFYYFIRLTWGGGVGGAESVRFSQGMPEPWGCGSAGSCCNPLLGWREGGGAGTLTELLGSPHHPLRLNY